MARRSRIGNIRDRYNFPLFLDLRFVVSPTSAILPLMSVFSEKASDEVHESNDNIKMPEPDMPSHPNEVPGYCAVDMGKTNVAGRVETGDVIKQSEEPKPKNNGWMCGDAFHYPMPKLEKYNEDPWEYCNTAAKDEVKDRCEKAKDEIDKLLIFAGLFSAVVSAFTIESYKWLQADPTDMTNQLLASISSKLSSQGSNPVSSQPPSSFEPDLWVIRVNALWFVSLMVSLTVAVVGILCLQWMREFLGTVGLLPRPAFALWHIRWEGFKAWHVLDIVACLPLMLQISLVLFFVGTVDFLWHQNSVVAIAASVVVGCTLAFLLITTIMPALQHIFTRDRYFQMAQCPYKSTQAMIFLRLFVLLSKPLAFLIFLLEFGPTMIISVRAGIGTASTLFIGLMILYDPPFGDVGVRKSWRYIVGKIIRFPSTSGDWLKMDLHWLAKRGQMAGSSNIQLTQHDLLDGLMELADTNGTTAFQKRRCTLDLNIPQDELKKITSVVFRMATRKEALLGPRLPSRQAKPKELPGAFIQDYLSQDMIAAYPNLTGDELQGLFNHFFELNVRLLNSGIDLPFAILPFSFTNGHGTYIIPDDILVEVFRIIKERLAEKPLGFFTSTTNVIILSTCLLPVWKSDPAVWTRKPWAENIYQAFHILDEYDEPMIDLQEAILASTQLTAIMSAVPEFSEEWTSHPTISVILKVKKESDEFRQEMFGDGQNIPTVKMFEETLKATEKNIKKQSALVLQPDNEILEELKESSDVPDFNKSARGEAVETEGIPATGNDGKQLNDPPSSLERNEAIAKIEAIAKMEAETNKDSLELS